MPAKPKTIIRTSETGSKVVELPISKSTVELRRPKGKDLVAIGDLAKSGANQVAVMFHAVSMLSGTLSYEALEDLDGEDILALGEGLSSFPVLSAAIG
jgi:Phage tail assembly chaperone proteins, E, or 41 or 14